MFDDAALWFDPDDPGHLLRPTEYAAFRNICAQSRGALSAWEQWKRDRDADLLGRTPLLENAALQAQINAEESAMLAWRKARVLLQQQQREAARRIRKTQMPLPGFVPAA